MKVAIMQPYFFPYIGYFQLIQCVEKFILLNDVQYIRHGWINRNRILKPETGIQYIIAPLEKHQQKYTIRNINVVNSLGWQQKILRQLEHYKKKAPCYKKTIQVLMESFESDAVSIADLNHHLLVTICQYIGINTPIYSSHTLGFDYTSVQEKDDWALQISKQLKASEYINPVGGSTLFNQKKFIGQNIKLSFLKSNEVRYSQHRAAFEPNLSIIDVMMFNEPVAIQDMLKQYKLV